MASARRRPRAAACAALAALVLAAACTDQTKQRESELTQLLQLLPGRYDNGSQAELDARSGVHPAHEHVALIIAKVYTPRLGHHVLYAQEMAADDPRRVFSQKMYGFEVDEKRGIVQTLYEFVDPLRWRDGQQNPDMFTALVSDDVQAEGCQLLWKKQGEAFVASHDPKACPDPASAAAQMELVVGALTVGDYRFRKGR
jgi:CpeT/CpcT family protein DUF1001